MPIKEKWLQNTESSTVPAKMKTQENNSHFLSFFPHFWQFWCKSKRGFRPFLNRLNTFFEKNTKPEPLLHIFSCLLGKFAYYVPLIEKGGRVHIVSYKKKLYHISNVWPRFSERCCYRVTKNNEFAHNREVITEYRIIHSACKNENAGE